MSSDTGGTDRIAALWATKLTALVEQHVGRPVGEPVGLGVGVALVHDGTAWVYLAEAPARRLGAAIAWTLRSQATTLSIVVDDPTDAGVLVRKADELALAVDVWVVDGRRLVGHDDRAPYPPTVPVRDDHLALWPLIVRGGASPVVEHGVLSGEVRGLEVCRVVDDPATGSTRLDVGVGAHDREAFRMIHGDVPPVESLARVVGDVVAQRAVDAPHHPLNRISPERFLRWRLERSPELVGALDLAPAEPPTPRHSLLDVTSCVARGVDAGGAVVVVCGAGTDLELVPDALDARRAAGIEGRLVVATRSGDRLAITDDLAALAVQSFELVSI